MPSRIVTVGTTPVKLLDMMACREQYIIQNQDLSNDLYINDTNEVATSGTRKGRILAPMGIESACKSEDSALIKKEQYGVAGVSITVWVWES